jgi:S-adenosylmethionine hydrolase
VAHVTHVDGYGNASLDLGHDDLPETGLRMGRRLRIGSGDGAPEAIFTVTFADVGEGGLLVYETSSRSLAVAVNRGSAADELGLAPGDEVVLRPA